MKIADKIKDIFGKARKKAEYETKVFKGKQGRAKNYYSRKKIKNEKDAQLAFIKAKERLFNVNGWNNVKAFAKTHFTLYDDQGKSTKAVRVKVGNFIKIEFPFPSPASWVMVHEVFEGHDTAEFVVRPSFNPTEKEKNNEIDHFYTTDSTSTFRVTLKDNLLSAYEIGRAETINNNQPQAGDRAVFNTLVSEGGWLFFQKYQWKHLTDYLVGI